MRILLLHPDDDPKKIACLKQKFDLVVDLGVAGHSSYQRWRESIGCPVKPIPKAEFTDLAIVQQALDLGVGCLVDDLGFDWWDLVSVRFYEQVLEVLRLQRLVDGCGPTPEIFLYGRGFHARVLNFLLPGRVRNFANNAAVPWRALQLVRRVARLRPSQVLEIAGDKYDGGYGFRRLLAAARDGCSEPVVLLPSAYSNASSVALGYAAILPDSRFLLVTTRSSGSVKDLPRNVSSAALASYARANVSNSELERLERSWQRLAEVFRQNRELSILVQAGYFDSVPRILKEGLSIRNAWLQVFASQRISAVLCADEMNWHTRLPILIARSQELPTAACHHGALDLRYSFRETSADWLLVKGRMERDYLVETCGLCSQQIEVAAPLRVRSSRLSGQAKKSIVFFSEPYENFGERCQEIYQEILPDLAELARQHDCEIVVKLHPYESLRTRKRLAESILHPQQRILLKVIDGPLQDELLERTWFAVTITSGAALDCALRRVPVFLCEWLDSSNSMYGEQFIKFRVAGRISGKEAISEIPSKLENFPVAELTNLWQTANPDRLRDLLSGALQNGPSKIGVAEARRA